MNVFTPQEVIELRKYEAQKERARCLKAVDDESEHICYVPRTHPKEVEEIIRRVKANIKRRIEEGA